MLDSLPPVCHTLILSHMYDANIPDLICSVRPKRPQITSFLSVDGLHPSGKQGFVGLRLIHQI